MMPDKAIAQNMRPMVAFDSRPSAYFAPRKSRRVGRIGLWASVVTILHK
jgi:hypothetical protein